MKKERTSFLNSMLIVCVLLLVAIGCTKENQVERIPEKKEHYILYSIEAFEPEDSSYYFKVEFENADLLYTPANPNIRLSPTSSSGFGNMIGKGFSFRNNASDDYFEVMFYKDELDSLFSFQLANYRYGNPWMSISGANVEYYTPTDQPNTFHRYLGTNVKDAYFRISWIDRNHLFGQFRTKLVDCCVEGSTFWVKGEFSIPRVYFDNH
jgi:hypothetical protein